MIGIVKKITTTDGHEIPWVDEVKYLGIFIVRSIPNSNVLLTMQNDHFSALQMAFFCQSWQTGSRTGYSRAIKTQMLTCSTVWTRGLCIG